MLGSGSMVRHPFIWGNKRDGAPITFEPGPDRISPPKRVCGFSRTGLRTYSPLGPGFARTLLSGGKRKPSEANLAPVETNTRAGKVWVKTRPVNTRAVGNG